MKSLLLLALLASVGAHPTEEITMAEQIMAEEAEDADEAEEAEVAEDPSLPFGTTRPIYEAFLAMDVDRSTYELVHVNHSPQLSFLSFPEIFIERD